MACQSLVLEVASRRLHERARADYFSASARERVGKRRCCKHRSGPRDGQQNSLRLCRVRCALARKIWRCALTPTEAATGRTSGFGSASGEAEKRDCWLCVPALAPWSQPREHEQLFGAAGNEKSTMQAFQDAARRATALPPQPDAVKLSLYAFYKQATVGNAPSQSPSAWDVVARAKWEAWGGVQGMDAERAQAEYVSLVNIREAAAGPPPIAADASRSSSGSRRPKASRDNCGFIMCLTRVASCDFGRDDEERSPLKEPQKLLVSSPPQTGKKFCCLGC